MKKILFTSMMFIWATILNAQVTQEWVQTSNAPNLAMYIAMDNAGNIYTAGSNLLLKYDPLGNLLWSQINSASGLAIDGNGDVIVAGTSTVKYDANGSVLWTVPITSFLPKSMAIDESNNIYLHGQGSAGLQTVKLNSSGVQQWIATYTGDFYDLARKKMVYKNGYIYVTGDVTLTVSPRNPPLRHILTMKYNASTGAQVWAVTYTHADKKNQYSTDLVVDGTGNIYVIGMVGIKAGSKINNNWGTLKYNASGMLQWVKFYDGNADDYDGSQPSDIPYDIDFDNSGNIIVCGTSYTTTGQFNSSDMTTIKYSPSGTQLWVKTYDDPSHSSGNAQAITSDGSSNVYITGYQTAPGNIAISPTIKYNSAGEVQWTANYNGGTARALLLDNSANVYVCGSASGSSLLIKYSQSSPLFTKMADPEIKDAGINILKLYPNPATDHITLHNGNDKKLGTVIIFDASGNKVYRNFTGNNQTMIDVNNLPSGVYYLRSDQSETSIKFVKQ